MKRQFARACSVSLCCCMFQLVDEEEVPACSDTHFWCQLSVYHTIPKYHQVFGSVGLVNKWAVHFCMQHVADVVLYIGCWLRDAYQQYHQVRIPVVGSRLAYTFRGSE